MKILAASRFMPRDEAGGESGGEGGAGGESGAGGGDDAASVAAAAAAATAATEAAAVEANGKEKTFTQTELDRIVQGRVKKLNEKVTVSEGRYETMIADQTRSDEDRAELAIELDELRAARRTDKENQKYASEQAMKAHTTALELANGTATKYQNLFESQTKNNAIMAAASQADAFNPELFIPILADRTSVIQEERDNGEKTGRYITQVRIQQKADDGTVNEALVTPAEAIEDMKNDPGKYGGLFRSNVAKGIGDGTDTDFASGKAVDLSKISDKEFYPNSEQYFKQYGVSLDRNRHGL